MWKWWRTDVLLQHMLLVVCQWDAVCVWGGAVWCWKKELFAPLPLKTFVCPLCFDCSWRGCAALGGEG